MSNNSTPSTAWVTLFCVFLLTLASALAAPGSKTAIAPNKTAEVAAVAAGPAGVKARPSLVGAITIEWKAVAGATRYIIAYSLSGDKNYTELATINGTAAATVYSFRNEGLGANETYYYKVKAVTGSGETDYSTPVMATTHAAAKVFNIMPFGDSNTHGTRSGDSRPVSERVAYRKFLYDLLNNAQVKFNYVGSEKSGSAFMADDENAGFPGARTMDLLALLKNGSYQNQGGETISRGAAGRYLDEYSPDMLLVHLGTNGGQYGVTDSDQAIAEMSTILDEVDAYEARANKEVTVVLARIISRIPNPNDPQAIPLTTKFNEKLEAMASKRIAEKSDRIVMVDMENEAGIVYNYTTQGGDMDDPLHPGTTGYQKMANQWFKVMKPLLEPATVDNRTPETTIASKPEANTNSRTATFQFSSNESKVIYELSYNGGTFAVTSNPVTFDNLADGTYTIAVRAVDAAGNIDATPATYTWTVDTKAPEAPVFTKITEDRGVYADDQITSDNTLLLSGTAEAGAVVTILEKIRGQVGTARAAANRTLSFSYESTALPEGTYHFSAKAQDAAGNQSQPGSEFKVTVDLTAPTVAISSGEAGPVKNAFTVEVKLSEEVFGLEASDFTVSNGTLHNLRAVDKLTYTATITPTSGREAVVAVSLATGKATDLAGNGNAASNKLETAYDDIAPSGYAVQFLTDLIDVTNLETAGIGVTGAEVGATYYFTITSSNGGEEITGSASATARNFTIASLSLRTLMDGTLTVTFYQVDAAGNKGREVTAGVRKVTRNVVEVKEIPALTVPFRTTYESLTLPEQVEVTYANGEKENLSINWERGNYNGLVAGAYNLSGELVLKPNSMNTDNRKAQIKVVVEPNQAPTVLNLSADTFEPDAKDNEIIGAFSTTDPDDDAHSYELVSGEGDANNDRFEIRGNELHLKSNRGLSGITSFVIRVRSTDPSNNSIEQTFTLIKSIYHPETKLKIVNAFTPDNDGVNDTWTVPELRFYNDVDIQVFDRAGIRLFHTTNPEEGWDGRGQNGQVQQGSYLFIIQVKDINLVQKGVLTVLK